jgi:cytoskeletal protein RodZ
MNETPQEKAPETPRIDVGALLRQKRMNRGQSLDAVHQQTRIPKKFLEALEANRMDVFPAGVYLRGFLKGYCDHLELDFDPLWRQLAPAESQPANGEPAAGSKGPAPAAETPRDRGADRATSRPMLLPVSEYTLVPVVFFALLIAGTVAYWMFNERAPSAERRGPKRVPSSSVPPIAPLAPATEPALKLTALKDTWIRLKVDGVLRFEGRIPAGASQEWKARKGFAIRPSDPADLRVTLDDKEMSLRELPKDPEGFLPVAR